MTLERLLPAAGWLHGYRRRWLSSDLVAGTTTAAVVIPQAMGYATVAGVPVQVGLYTCIVPMAIYALLGGSRRLSFSTTSTIVALTALALASAGVDGDADDAMAAAATLTLLVGVTLLVFRLLQLGWLVETVSEATIVGLKWGVGLTIIVDQLPKLLGVPAADDGFFHDVGHAASHLDDASAVTAVLAFGTIACLVALPSVLPRVPGPLVALAVGIGLTWLADLGDRGVDLVTEVPTGLPVPAAPSLDHVGALWPYAVAIGLMSYFESVTAARIARRPDDPPLDNNGEGLAVGAAALGGSFFGSVPPAGGFSQTQVNTGAGARTQLSEVVTVVWAVGVALFLAPVMDDLPEATLGAIVAVAVGGLLSWSALARLAHIDRVEVVIALVTAAAALAANLLVGVAVGVAATYYVVLRSLNHPQVVELRRARTGVLEPARPEDAPVPGMLILRIEGGLYTLNVRRVQTQIFERVAGVDPPPSVLVLDVGATADTSVTVLDIVAETAHDLGKQGVTLWVAAIPTRALEKAQRTVAWSSWSDAGRLHPTAAAAVDAFQGQGEP